MTLHEEILALAAKAESPDVRGLLEHAAQLEQMRPKWRAGKVRIRQRNCKGCEKGVVFEGTEKAES